MHIMHVPVFNMANVAQVARQCRGIAAWVESSAFAPYLMPRRSMDRLPLAFASPSQAFFPLPSSNRINDHVFFTLFILNS
jgi:hypothetical protein